MIFGMATNMGITVTNAFQNFIHVINKMLQIHVNFTNKMHNNKSYLRDGSFIMVWGPHNEAEQLLLAAACDGGDNKSPAWALRFFCLLKTFIDSLALSPCQWPRINSYHLVSNNIEVSSFFFLRSQINSSKFA